MIKLDPMDGENVLYMHPERPVVMLSLLVESEAAAHKMGYIHSWRCFVNYLIAHYKGHYEGNAYHVNYPLEES